MKRKAASQPSGNGVKGILKKRAKIVLSDEEVKKRFRKGLFNQNVLEQYITEYKQSEPYKYAVINTLVDDSLLRSVRKEVIENVQFTPKETDIYKIHQSGDLANLDGLDEGALEKFPSLLKLRDAVYSANFRKYVAAITGCGELSGRKTDMAINVYTPGCHLLCHDDVIGSRRVSYILYLTDPDLPWQAEWGGALRLFPTQDFEEDGEVTKTPQPDVTKIIPPAWNQLSFFAVQPGESFHDVEEVYHAANKEQLEKDGGRVRMAISGWFHIPQPGEEGFVKGAEEKWGANSSLLQLQGHPDRYDRPQASPVEIILSADSNRLGLDVADLDFLLKYMAPTYLTPDTLEQINSQLLDLSCVTLDGLLSQNFAAKVKAYIEEQEAQALPENTVEIEKSSSWKVAKPPHKQRYLYLEPSAESAEATTPPNPLQELVDVFLPSPHFRRWLALAAECNFENYDILARRFRRGQDYALAASHGDKTTLELSLGLTPTDGWGAEEEEEEEEEDDGNSSDASTIPETAGPSKGAANTKAKGKDRGKETPAPKPKPASPPPTDRPEIPDVGGHEVYMAADEDGTGDAAIYRTSSSSRGQGAAADEDDEDDEDDDAVLFSITPAWNKMSLVLRDAGVLRFVKYVSRNAAGDRWDVVASWGVREDDEDEDEEEDEQSEGKGENDVSLEDSADEQVFHGFASSSADSDSE